MQKLFTNDNFFFAMVLCFVIGGLADAFLATFVCKYPVQPQLTMLFRIFCCIFLYSSYKKHSKNVMKGLMGALLGAQVITSIQYLSEITIPMEYVCTPLFLICSVMLFINHFIINSNHYSSPKMIRLNQILAVLLGFVNVVWAFVLVIDDPSAMMCVVMLFDTIGFLGMIATIVCVESRLDAYRLDREAAGWTEETGYPEGYVHEYEKKDNK